MADPERVEPIKAEVKRLTDRLAILENQILQDKARLQIQNSHKEIARDIRKVLKSLTKSAKESNDSAKKKFILSYENAKGNIESNYTERNYSEISGVFNFLTLRIKNIEHKLDAPKFNLADFLISSFIMFPVFYGLNAAVRKVFLYPFKSEEIIVSELNFLFEARKSLLIDSKTEKFLTEKVTKINKKLDLFVKSLEDGSNNNIANGVLQAINDSIDANKLSTPNSLPGEILEANRFVSNKFKQNSIAIIDRFNGLVESYYTHFNQRIQACENQITSDEIPNLVNSLSDIQMAIPEINRFYLISELLSKLVDELYPKLSDYDLSSIMKYQEAVLLVKFLKESFPNDDWEDRLEYFEKDIILQFAERFIVPKYVPNRILLKEPQYDYKNSIYARVNPEVILYLKNHELNQFWKVNQKRLSVTIANIWYKDTPIDEIVESTLPWNSEHDYIQKLIKENRREELIKIAAKENGFYEDILEKIMEIYEINMESN